MKCQIRYMELPYHPERKNFLISGKTTSRREMSVLINCFSKLSSNDTSVLNETSITYLKKLTVAYVLWILVSFLNVPAAVLTYFGARKSKAMRGTTTNAFLQQANLCITAASISFSIMGAVHISNGYFGRPETLCRYACFIRISHQGLLFSLANSFILVMAVDRFFATVTPLQYSNLVGTSSSKLVRNVSVAIWILESLFYGLRFLDTMNPVLAVCTFTMVEGRHSFYILCCKLLLFGLLSVTLYMMAVFIVHRQHKSQTLVTSIANSSSLAEIKRRHQKQMFKALTLHSVVQACTLLVCYVKLLYGAIVISDRGSTNGPYFTVLNTTSGLSNFVIYLVCLKVFRQNCLSLFNGSETTTAFTKA